MTHPFPITSRSPHEAPKAGAIRSIPPGLPRPVSSDPHKPNSITMKLEDMVRALAGTLVLAGLALAHTINANWLWLTAFVGVNLLQSAFTGFCPAELILKKLGLGGANTPKA